MNIQDPGDTSIGPPAKEGAVYSANNNAAQQLSLRVSYILCNLNKNVYITHIQIVKVGSVNQRESRFAGRGKTMRLDVNRSEVRGPCSLLFFITTIADSLNELHNDVWVRLIV